jgi:hypothetical protein
MLANLFDLTTSSISQGLRQLDYNRLQESILLKLIDNN